MSSPPGAPLPSMRQQNFVCLCPPARSMDKEYGPQATDPRGDEQAGIFEQIDHGNMQATHRTRSFISSH